MIKGSIIFFRDDSLLSRVIRWFTKSEKSHVAVVVHYCPKHDKSIILDSDTGFIYLRSLNRALSIRKKASIEVFAPVGTKERMGRVDSAIENLYRYVDEPYSITRILGFAVTMLLRRLGVYIDNPFGLQRACSEIIRGYLVDAGYAEFGVWRNPTPHDLYLQVKGSHEFVRVSRRNQQGEDK